MAYFSVTNNDDIYYIVVMYEKWRTAPPSEQKIPNPNISVIYHFNQTKCHSQKTGNIPSRAWKTPNHIYSNDT